MSQELIFTAVFFPRHHHILNNIEAQRAGQGLPVHPSGAGKIIKPKSPKGWLEADAFFIA
jgi:hypothetical protein